MVHTQPASVPEHLPYLAEIAVAAFSGTAFARFTRPRYAEFPERSFYLSLKRLRNAAISPSTVIRVAVADDHDPWVDVGLMGLEAEPSRWVRGTLVNGEWQYAQLQPTVCEGRALGHAVWERKWPEDAADAASAKLCNRANAVWPADTLRKKAERAALSLETAYRDRVNPDPAVAPDALALIDSEGEPQLRALLAPALERSKHVGHITLHSLAVDPAFQRCGVGARLMRWGIGRAEAERCPILLVATASGAQLYKHLGFESYGIITVRELTGDQVMAYWPKSFLDRADGEALATGETPTSTTNQLTAAENSKIVDV